MLLACLRAQKSHPTNIALGGPPVLFTPTIVCDNGDAVSGFEKFVPAHIPWPVIPAACLGVFSALLANLVSFRMIEKLNTRLPERERISYVWWGSEVRRTFKQTYPRDKMVVALDASVVTMVLCFLVVIRYWVFG